MAPSFHELGSRSNSYDRLSDQGPGWRLGGMPMIKHADSHLDHALTEAQIDHLFAAFADRGEFFIAELELPVELGTVPCGLHGPKMGDPPVPDHEVTRERRGERAWSSRLVERPVRQVRTVTVIAGPHAGEACVLFTAFGGPLAPQEPGDVRRQLEELERTRGALSDRSPESAEHTAVYAQIVALREKRAAADTFWSEHALSR